MAGTVTLTGTAGAGLTVAASVFTDIATFLVDMNKNLVTLQKNDGTWIGPISITAATTFTATKSGSAYTITIS